MAFFNFGPKIDPSKDYPLAEVPFFSSLNSSEQKNVYKKARLEECRRGDIIYTEGTHAEFFYVILSGRVRIFKKARSPVPEKTLGYLYRGDHFGESSILTGRTHSASAEAMKDLTLLKIPREDFNKLIADIPAISLHLNRSLGYRLTRDNEPIGSSEVKIAAFFTPTRDSALTEFWFDFAQKTAMESHAKVALIDLTETEDPFLKSHFNTEKHQFDLRTMDPTDESDLKSHMNGQVHIIDYLRVLSDSSSSETEKKFHLLITHLTYIYRYLFIQLPFDSGAALNSILNQTDFVYIFYPENENRLDRHIAAIQSFEKKFGFTKNEIRIIKQDASGSVPLRIDHWSGHLEEYLFHSIPPKITNGDRYQSTLRFLARDLSGNLIGLALGGGAAYGFAHIGVMKVLEREGIIPDMVAGSSMGALIGSMWASGISGNELERIASGFDKKSAFLKLIGFHDVSFVSGFLKGDQIKRYLESIIGHRSFHEMKIPLKVVAVDLFTAECVTLETGCVVDAVRASISIPGVFSPVLLNNRYLIDGGIVDPLPVRVLSKRGVKKIIAVNVLAGPDDHIIRNRIACEKTMAQPISNLPGTKTSSVHLKPNKKAVNILNVMMNTVQFMEYELSSYLSHEADVYIHPVVHDGHWAEFYSAPKFIQAGEQKTMEHLEEIKKLITETY